MEVGNDEDERASSASSGRPRRATRQNTSSQRSTRSRRGQAQQDSADDEDDEEETPEPVMVVNSELITQDISSSSPPTNKSPIKIKAVQPQSPLIPSGMKIIGSPRSPSKNCPRVIPGFAQSHNVKEKASMYEHFVGKNKSSQPHEPQMNGSPVPVHNSSDNIQHTQDVQKQGTPKAMSPKVSHQVEEPAQAMTPDSSAAKLRRSSQASRRISTRQSLQRELKRLSAVNKSSSRQRSSMYRYQLRRSMQLMAKLAKEEAPAARSTRSKMRLVQTASDSDSCMSPKKSSAEDGDDEEDAVMGPPQRQTRSKMRTRPADVSRNAISSTSSEDSAGSQSVRTTRYHLALIFYYIYQ